jgi:phosphate:Na+ symporter
MQLDLVIGLVSLAGNIALLLWGTRMVQTGIQRAFGPNLRTFLGKTLNDRFKAFLAGLGVTAILQSSTATGLMAAGFAAGGLVDLMPALSVMLGANVGTTLIVQVLSFDVAAVYPALVLIGFIMFKRETNPQVHDLGRVFIGLGFMLLSLHQLLAIMEQYSRSSALSFVLHGIAATPLLSVLLAALLTWAAHSSVAVVLLVMSLAAKGLVDPYQAFALVLGANLGTSINPVIEGNSGRDLASKRLPIGNFLTRLFGVMVTIAVLTPVTRLVGFIDSDPARAVANFHTAFNLLLAIVFLPFLRPYADFLVRILPQKVDDLDPSRPKYLDQSARETPVVALGMASREALRLVDVLREMIDGCRTAISDNDRGRLTELRKKDDVIDSLNTAIKTYLTSIDPDELGEADRRRMDEVLIFSMNVEQGGDVLDQNLLPHLAKRIRRGLTFSKAGQDELGKLFDRLKTNLDAAASLFISQDERLARTLANEKVVFRNAEREQTAYHFERLRKGGIDTIETSSLHLDIIRDIKQINSHLVAAAAYPMLERQGELLQSRIPAVS